MKTLVKSFAFLVIVIAGTWLFPQRASAQNEPVSLQVFYDELSPYGQWIESPTYGYVWAPDVDQDFEPYVTNGHWVYTDYGWTWVSDFQWGWAPFHYGRWYVDPNYGNVWVPDTEWGPAWVSWRQANGYIGWTPMGPGVNINIALGNSYYVPRDRWNFVRQGDFMQYNLNRYCIDRSLSFNIFNISMMIRNTRFDNDRHSTYFFGPRRDDIQRYSGRIINPVHIRDYNRPGQSYDRDYLSIYRPQIQTKRSNAYGQSPAPRNINRGGLNDREEAIRNRGNAGSNGNFNNPGRNAQQGNAYPSRNQGEQPSRGGNSGYQGRGNQTVQQPNVNPTRSQGEQPSRGGNSGYQGRTSQPTQQPANTNPMRSGNTYFQGRTTPPTQQATQQPNGNSSRGGNSGYQGRTAQPVQQQQRQAAPQQSQREARPAQQNVRQQESSSPRTIVNVRQEKARMDVKQESNKREDSNRNSPRR